MGKNTAKKFAIGASIAAAAGYIAGILTAPKSGKETRQDVKDTASKAVTEAEKQLKKLESDVEDLVSKAKDKGSDLSDKAKDELDNLLKMAKDSRGKASEMLSAVKDGKAEDKDLSKAIADATKAIDHLRDYLSK